MYIYIHTYHDSYHSYDADTSCAFSQAQGNVCWRSFGAAAKFFVPRWTAIRAANLGSKPNIMVLLTM